MVFAQAAVIETASLLGERTSNVLAFHNHAGVVSMCLGRSPLQPLVDF